MTKTKEALEVFALFDGECIMCNNFVSLLDRSGKGSCKRLIVTASPNRFTELIGSAVNIDVLDKKSKKTIIVYKEDAGLLEKSRAVASLLRATSSKKMMLTGRMIMLTPIWLADATYDLISRYRKRIPLKACSLNRLTWVSVDE